MVELSKEDRPEKIARWIQIAYEDLIAGAPFLFLWEMVSRIQTRNNYPYPLPHLLGKGGNFSPQMGYLFEGSTQVIGPSRISGTGPVVIPVPPPGGPSPGVVGEILTLSQISQTIGRGTLHVTFTVTVWVKSPNGIDLIPVPNVNSLILVVTLKSLGSGTQTLNFSLTDQNGQSQISQDYVYLGGTIGSAFVRDTITGVTSNTVSF